MLHAAVQASTIDGGEDTLARTPLVHSDPAQVGRYRLTARLGAGGMGVVYLGLAEDGTPVAVKLLRPELADDPEFRTRFTREVSNLDRVMGVCTVRVIEADTEFQAKLRALKDSADVKPEEAAQYEFVLSNALDTVDTSAEDHRKLQIDLEDAAKHKKLNAAAKNSGKPE